MGGALSIVSATAASAFQKFSPAAEDRASRALYRLTAVLHRSAAVGRIGAIDDALERVKRILPGAVPGVEVQRVAHAALEHGLRDGARLPHGHGRHLHLAGP